MTTKPPDIVVLDLDMPGGPGVDALRELERLMPQVRVLIFTGYLTKNAASRDLVEAIMLAAAITQRLRADHPSDGGGLQRPSHRLRAVRHRGGILGG